MLRRHTHLIALILLLLAAAIVGLAFFHDRPPTHAAVHSLRSWQEADAPLGYPVEVSIDSPGRVPAFDPRFTLLDAFERFRIPPSPRFDHPLGSEHGALSYNAQPFFELNNDFGANHWGDDLNGIGGMNTDLGDPVRAVGNGLVLFAAKRDGGWGNVVILGHRLADGHIVQTLYAHLHTIGVARGALVARGQTIGTVGTAGGTWPAHLHFELYEAESIDPGRGYALFPANRLDPTAFIQARRGAIETDLAPSPLGVGEPAGWEGQLILEDPHKVPALFE